MTVYMANVAREGEWWVFTVEGVGATQAKTLEGAENVVADMIRATLGVEGEIEFGMDFTDEQASAYYEANQHRLDEIFDPEDRVTFEGWKPKQ